MPKFLSILLCSLVILIKILNVQSVNILYIETIPSPSHHVWHKTLTYALAAKGYNLTVVSADIEKHNLKTLHYIHLEKVYEQIYSSGSFMNFFDLSKLAFYNEILSAFEFYTLSCEGSYASAGYKQLINYPPDFKFDLVIYDHIIGACLLSLADRFNKPPIIGATAYHGYETTVDLIGDALTFPFHNSMMLKCNVRNSFYCRFTNFVYHVFDMTYKRYVFDEKLSSLARQHYDKNVDILDLERRMQLVLINSDKALDTARVFAPNVIAVGGLQIQKPKPLPENVEKIFNGTKKGIILFSLGTNVLSTMLGDDRITAFIEAFKSFNDYDILWKAVDIESSVLPKNVHIHSWLPQNDILANPKTKLFITHSGLLSTQEATSYGVPMIGMPVFADQFSNIELTLPKGTAERLLFQDFTAEALKTLMNKVLNDPKYRNNAMMNAKLFSDQKETPLERAIWWIEWVLRHPNSKVFELPGKTMSQFQRLSLDVYLFVVIVAIIILKIFIFSFRKLRKLTKPSEGKRKTN